MAGLPSKQFPHIRLGNAPCSWGIMGGFAPDPMPTYREVLDGIASAHFVGTELGDWGFMPTDEGTLGPELAERGLAMIGAFTPLRLSDWNSLRQAQEAALRAARLLSHLCDSPSPSLGPFLIVAEASTPERMALAGRASPADSLPPAGWHALSKGLQEVARWVLEETGISTVFHPHSGTPVETLLEAERLMEMTHPQLIGLCLDTGHVAYAGTDPLAALERFGERVWHVHFKDFRPEIADRARALEWDYHAAVANRLFCPLGQGAVDFRALLDRLTHFGYRGWIVVEDEVPPGECDPLENALNDRRFLRELGL